MKQDPERLVAAAARALAGGRRPALSRAELEATVQELRGLQLAPERRVLLELAQALGVGRPPPEVAGPMLDRLLAQTIARLETLSLEPEPEGPLDLSAIRERALLTLRRFLLPAADCAALGRGLRPQPEDYARVFVPEHAVRARAAYEALWAGPEAFPAPRRGQTALLCEAAWSQDLGAEEPPPRFRTPTCWPAGPPRAAGRSWGSSGRPCRAPTSSRVCRTASAGSTSIPAPPHALHYRQAQIPALRRWGQAVLAERALAGQGGASWELLRAFDGYRVILRPGAQTSSALVLAPDEKGRRLAAVFTAEDCLDAYLGRHGAALGAGAALRVLRGAELFPLLTAMPLDGIVFDCCGPVTPKAVAPAFAAVVMGG